MTSLFAAALLWSGQPSGADTFADAWDRWVRLDGLWSAAEARRADALPHLQTASGLIFGHRWSAACERMDSAIATLEGREVRPEDAVILRFKPSLSEPGRPARLVASWAYKLQGAAPVRISIGDRTVLLHPSSTLNLDVKLSGTGQANVGTTTRDVPLSILKNGRKRLDALLRNEEDEVRQVGAKASAMLSGGSPGIAEMIEWGERLGRPQASLRDFGEVPFAREGQTAIRAVFPDSKRSEAPLTAVIALAGWGGEAAFFESFGQGTAPKEALKRGWALVGASQSDSAVKDALAFVESTMERKLARYFVIGQSRAAAVALSSRSLAKKPAAIALLSPAAVAAPQSWFEGPTLFAIGKRDAVRVVSAVQAIVRELGERKDVRLLEKDECEHLMLPGVAVGDAFLFFDEHAAR